MGRIRACVLYHYAQLLAGILLWCGIILIGPEAAWKPAGEGFQLIAFVLPQSALILVLFIASWAAIRFKFSMSSSYFISFDIAFSTVAFLLVSPFAGAVLALFMVGVDYLYRRRSRSMARGELVAVIVGNGGNRLLRFGAVWLAYQWLGGTLPPGSDPRNAAAALGGFGVYFLVNNVFFMPVELLKGNNLRDYWREAFTEDLGLSFAICALGYLLSVVALAMGGGAFLLLGAFAIMGSWLLSKLTRTQDQLKRKVDDLMGLSKVSAAANSGLDVMPIVESFARTMAESLPVDGIGVVFYQRYATTLYLVQVEGEKSRSTYLPEEKRFQYDQLPLSEPSERLGQRLFEFLQPLETAPFMIPASVLGLPLLHGGEPFGGIVVYSYKENVPLHERQWLLETCAQSLVMALENCFLHLQAIQDPLTGLFNRSYFLYRLEEELSYSTRHRAPFALMMLDLDDFKAVNDHLGHATGDSVIRRIGDLLRRSLRREDVPARYGGDEFTVMLLNCSLKDAMDKAERLRAILAAKALPKEEAYGLAIGCSVGILHSDRLGGDQDVPNLLRRLDKALYQAKEKGKNQVVLGG